MEEAPSPTERPGGPDRLTAAELARVLGMSERAVTKRMDAGRLAFEVELRGGRRVRTATLADAEKACNDGTGRPEEWSGSATARKARHDGNGPVRTGNGPSANALAVVPLEVHEAHLRDLRAMLGREADLADRAEREREQARALLGTAPQAATRRSWPTVAGVALVAAGLAWTVGEGRAVRARERAATELERRALAEQAAAEAALDLEQARRDAQVREAAALAVGLGARVVRGH